MFSIYISIYHGEGTGNEGLTRVYEHDLDVVLAKGMVAAEAPAPQAVLGSSIRAAHGYRLHCCDRAHVDDHARPLLDLL